MKFDNFDVFDVNKGLATFKSNVLQYGKVVDSDFSTKDVKVGAILFPWIFDAVRNNSFDFVPGGKIDINRLEAWYDYKDKGNRDVWVFDYPRYNEGSNMLAVVRQPSDCGSALVVCWLTRMKF